MKIGIIREGKFPPDRRVPLTPEQCRYVMDEMKEVEVVVQPSKHRCYSDDEYVKSGIRLEEDLSDCEVLMGVKEVLPEALIPGKIYFFFSHTIKRQPHNRHLLQEIVRKRIQLVDYEVLTDRNGMRVIGFGYFAGLIGAYKGIQAYGLRNGLYTLKPAPLCLDMQEILREVSGVNLKDVRIAVTGGGRVAGGVLKLLESLGAVQLTVDEFLSGKRVGSPAFVQLNPGDYNRHKQGLPFDLLHFYNHPEQYTGTFDRFLKATDMLIAAAYWDPAAPVLFSHGDTLREDFRIRVIADITCDINGSVPSTLKASAIDEPFYDYDPLTGSVREPFSSAHHITVMAVDNLPGALPRDASADFGRSLMARVLPFLAGDDPEEIIHRGSIARDGSLTDRFRYLQEYLDGRNP